MPPPRGTLGFTTTVLIDASGRLLDAMARRPSVEQAARGAGFHVGVGTTLFGQGAAVDWNDGGSSASYVGDMSFRAEQDQLSILLDPNNNEGCFVMSEPARVAAFLVGLRTGIDGEGATFR